MTASTAFPKLWQVVLLGAAVCAAVSALRLLAWYDGTRGRYGLLMLANLLRLGVVLFAYCLVLWAVGAETRERPAMNRLNLLSITCAVVILLVCAGIPTLWPVPLGVLTITLAVQLARDRTLLAPGWKPVLLRASLGVALFMFIWYQGASTTNSALRGLGERIEATVGSERLREWAKQQIEGVPPGQNNTLRWDEVPEDVFDMMGNIRGWPLVRVVHSDERSVTLANGSGYGYGVSIYPYDEGEPTRHALGLRWRPGIFLSTVSK
jgi:hypothetical protein